MMELTERQAGYVQDLARRAGIEVPDGFQSTEELDRWIAEARQVISTKNKVIEKQQELLCELCRELGMEVPNTEGKSKYEVSRLIDELKQKVEKVRAEKNKPTQAQIQFAKDLSRETGQALPDLNSTTKQQLSDWIATALQQRRKEDKKDE